jgi:ATP-dependent exoDNAse (exonuclease V) alpha subunit
MPVIARRHAKQYDTVNNETFIISQIDFKNEIITVTDNCEKFVDVPVKDFQKMFYPAFAITIYKSQGSTFDYPYTIHEFNHPRFDRRLKYVAMSRATNFENINIII